MKSFSSKEGEIAGAILSVLPKNCFCDEDPSTIGTYSQACAQFGLGMLWFALSQYPMIVVVQEMCAIGLVTGSGLAAVIKKKYSRKVVLTIASLILVVNTINIGADIGAMAASVKLLVPQLPVVIATLSFAAFIIVSEMLIPYSKYVKILKYLTISLLAYVGTAIIVRGNFKNLLLASSILSDTMWIHIKGKRKEDVL